MMKSNTSGDSDGQASAGKGNERKKVSRQPVLLGMLSLILTFILVSSLTGGSDEPAEIGFDGPRDLGLFKDEPIPPLINTWKPPIDPRNPFVGPFSRAAETSGTEGGADPAIGSVTEESDSASGDSTVGGGLSSEPLGAADLDPIQDPGDLDLGELFSQTPEADLPPDFDLDELLGLTGQP